MNYVVTASLELRREWLAYKKAHRGNVIIPKRLHGAATDVGVLQAAKLNPLLPAGTRV